MCSSKISCINISSLLAEFGLLELPVVQVVTLPLLSPPSQLETFLPTVFFIMAEYRGTNVLTYSKSVFRLTHSPKHWDENCENQSILHHFAALYNNICTYSYMETYKWESCQLNLCLIKTALHFYTRTLKTFLAEIGCQANLKNT